ncbi:MAG: GNAT family N-acetyltransferase [Bacteroidota bacterium]
MQLLQATQSDLAQLTPLFDAYRVFYQQASDPIACQDFLLKRLARAESTIFLARNAEGQGVGFTQLYPSFSSVRMRRLWVLNDLFVHTSHRRRGVGKALLQRAADWAKETGASALMLETGVNNLPAQALYEALGWERNDGYYVYYLSV